VPLARLLTPTEFAHAEILDGIRISIRKLSNRTIIAGRQRKKYLNRIKKVKGRGNKRSISH